MGLEGELVVVDLHDLKAGLAKDVVRAVLEEEPAAGALIFITGRGRHTVGAEPVLKRVTEGLLRERCAAVEAHRYRPAGPGRWVWITDPARAPSSVTGGSGCWQLVGVGLFVLAAVVGLVARC